jgi:hypothetical protein
MSQNAFFCGCGAPSLYALGRCERCYRRLRLSREKFEGRREETLARDGYACLVCGGIDLLIVHHRTRRKFATLCRGHHSTVHHLGRLRYGMNPLFVQLWREQHPDQPLQLELRLASGAITPAFRLAGLFEAEY